MEIEYLFVMVVTDMFLSPFTIYYARNELHPDLSNWKQSETLAHVLVAGRLVV